MNRNTNLIVEHIISKLICENDSDLVVNNEERFHLEDYIQYYNKPGVIVAILKGNTNYGIQQLPIGAVDSFRFMKITDENAIKEQNKNNGKSYDQILTEYENEKGELLDTWSIANGDKIEQLKNKYGSRFIGLDIVPNEKKIQVKDTEDNEEDEEQNKKDDNVSVNNNDNELVQEEDEEKSILKKVTQGIAKFFKNNEDKIVEKSNERIEKLKKKSSNDKFFDKIQKIQDEYVGDKEMDQIDKQTQTKIVQELYKIEKEAPKELKELKYEEFKKDGLNGVDDFIENVKTLNDIKQKTQTKDDKGEVQKNSEQNKTKEQSNDNNDTEQKQQINEGVLGLLFDGVMGIFKLGWSMLSVLWAHPLAAGSLCLLFYIMSKNKKTK